MEQPTTAQSWVQVPQHRQWGFEEPRSELLKIIIDLRAKEHQPTHCPPPEIGYGPSLSSILSHHQQAKASDSSCPGSLRLLILSRICRSEGNSPAGLMSQSSLYFAALGPFCFYRILMVESAKRESATWLIPGRELSSIWNRRCRRSQRQILWWSYNG